MSHATGIKPSEGLLEAFPKSKDGKIRSMKISIAEEELVLDDVSIAEGSWEDDYDNAISGWLEDTKPCYIFYRLDLKNETGYDWLYIFFCPDRATVREKMLYAATRATLKNEFGGGQVKDELHGTTRGDVELNGYLRHKEREEAPAPLTQHEEELIQVKASERDASIGINSQQQSVSGISFPTTPAAQAELEDFAAGRRDFVQLTIIIDDEMIDTAGGVAEADPHDLKTLLPENKPSYSLFRFKHNHEGDYLESVVFIYSISSSKSSIRERMLYSSCKAPLTEACEAGLGLVIAKKIEVDDPRELGKEFIYDEVHPKQHIVKQQFQRPKGPPGRGARRMVRNQNGDNGQED